MSLPVQGAALHSPESGTELLRKLPRPDNTAVGSRPLVTFFSKLPDHGPTMWRPTHMAQHAASLTSWRPVPFPGPGCCPSIEALMHNALIMCLWPTGSVSRGEHHERAANFFPNLRGRTKAKCPVPTAHSVGAPRRRRCDGSDNREATQPGSQCDNSPVSLHRATSTCCFGGHNPMPAGWGKGVRGGEGASIACGGIRKQDSSEKERQ